MKILICVFTMKLIIIPIEAGNYKIEIFADGFLIGETSLGLR